MPANVEALEKKYLIQTYARYPLVLERGEGCWVYDTKGRKYLDLLGGIGVNMLGHNHPRVVKAIRDQSRKALHVSNLYYHPYQGPLAARLAKISGLDRVFICNSGTEAWEGALKLARAYSRKISPDKFGLVAMDNSFHGRTMGAVATTGQEKYRTPYEPLLPAVEFARFNDSADLEARVNERTSAICIEVIQGEGGISEVSTDFLANARRLADKFDALLILDEIQCGLGRTGRWFAYQNHGIRPDVVTVAKPLAAGLPLAAFIATEKVAASFTPGMHGSTFGGGPLGCRLALEFLDVMQKDKLLAHVGQMGRYFIRQLAALKKKFPVIKEVRGRGLMLALDLSVPARPYVDRAHAQGLLINSTHDTVLRFLPPYILQTKHVDAAMVILYRIFSELNA